MKKFLQLLLFWWPLGLQLSLLLRKQLLLRLKPAPWAAANRSLNWKLGAHLSGWAPFFCPEL